MQVDSEKKIERYLVERITAKGGLCIKLLSNYAIGLPDRLCVFPGGKIVFVELKTTGQKPRKIQVFMHEKLRAIGAQVYVIDSLFGVDNFIETKV